MKNLLFGAIACIAFTGTSFASNEVVRTDVQNKKIEISKKSSDFKSIEDDSEKKPCKYSATFTDRSGRKISKSGEALDGKPVTARDCGLFFSKWISDLEEQGLEIVDSGSTWG